jgi:hypothetical protein
MAQGGVPFHQLGAPAVALPPPQVLGAGHTYGIAYDLFTNNIQANLPDGWASYRCKLLCWHSHTVI